MGRSVHYRPKKERKTSLAERNRYKEISRQVQLFGEEADPEACVIRINDALEKLKRLEMEDLDAEFAECDLALLARPVDQHDVNELSSKGEPEEPVEQSLAQRFEDSMADGTPQPSQECVPSLAMEKIGIEASAASDDIRKLSEQCVPSLATEKIGIETSAASDDVRYAHECLCMLSLALDKIGSETSAPSFVKDIPSPTRSRRPALAESPVSPSKCKRKGPADDKQEIAGSGVDYSPVGTAIALRQDLERQAHQPLMTPREQMERISLEASPSSRKSFVNDSPAKIPEKQDFQSLSPHVDYRPVGTAKELRQDFERRQSLGFKQELTPTKQNQVDRRSSLGSDSVAIDASAFSPGQSDYKEPAAGSTNKLKHFFEEKIRGLNDNQSKTKKNLTALLGEDERRLQKR